MTAMRARYGWRDHSILGVCVRVRACGSSRGCSYAYSEFRLDCPFTVFHDSFLYGFCAWRYERMKPFSGQFCSSWKNGPLLNVPFFCSSVVFASIFGFSTEEMFLANPNGQSEWNSLYVVGVCVYLLMCA